jgi:hypothetical protein
MGSGNIKTFFGQTGVFEASDVLRSVCQWPFVCMGGIKDNEPQ